MAQFDVHRIAGSEALVVDCRWDLLSHIQTRFVAPLVTHPQAPTPTRRLNPTFTIVGREYILLTQSASAIDRRKLGERVCSFDGHRTEIIDALDMLITGV